MPADQTTTGVSLDGLGWSWTRSPVHVDGPSATAMSWLCGPDSDLWRLTAGGPIKHDAYAYVHGVATDFVLEGEFDARLASRYDQLGFVVWGGEQRWLKTGFELDGGEVLVGAVHTASHSDWSCSASALPGAIRVRRSGGTVEVSSREGRHSWRMIRQLFLDGPVSVGPYSAAPLGPGFRASLTGFAMQHDPPT